MAIACDYAEFRGNAFAGEVYALCADRLDDFYRDFRHLLSDTGRKSFLKALGIPPAFFEERNDALKDDLVVDTKAAFQTKRRSETLLMAVVDGYVRFCAPEGPLGSDGPEQALGLKPEDWSPFLVDYGAGVIRYVRLAEQMDVDRYTSTLFLDLPVFYHKALSFDLGVFRVRALRGAVDKVNAEDPLTLKPADLSKGSFEKTVRRLDALVWEKEPFQQSFLDRLRRAALSFDRIRILLRALEEDKKTPWPKTLTKNVRRHLDLLEKGKALPAFSPHALENAFDLFDTACHYARDFGTVPTRRRAEIGVWSYFDRLDAAALKAAAGGEEAAEAGEDLDPARIRYDLHLNIRPSGATA